MKTGCRMFLSALFIALAGWPISLRAEVEPNNSADQANTLAANGSDAGALDKSTDGEDWWKVTISADGKLVIATSSVATLEIDNYLYDQNKTKQIASYLHSGASVADTVLYANLLAGTYYIKTSCWSGQGSYSITSTFIATAFANDAEPNDSAAAAIAWGLNGATTGHLGFYGNNYTDLADWRRVTTTQDGKLIIATYSDATIEIDNYIYDANRTTQLAGYKHSGAHREDTSECPNLVAGTYYIFTKHWSGYGSYTITNVLIPSSLPNDLEPNDSAAVALPFGVDSSKTGHLGFIRAGYLDPEDWRVVTTTVDGKLVVATYSDATIEIDNYIFDTNRTTQLAGYKHSGAHREDTSEYVNLGPGTYYIRTRAWSGYGSYSITSRLLPAQLPNDIEPNGTLAQAKTLTMNNRVSGHLGYYQAAKTDDDDYYQITLTQAADTLFVRTDTHPTLEVDLFLLNPSGQTVASGGVYGTVELCIAPKLAAGTYYVRVTRWSGYGSYYLFASTVRPGANPVSVEEKAEALPTEFSLAQNYPNPFNPKTVVSFQLPVASKVWLVVYDLLGREVATLVDENKPAGVYTVQFDATGFPSGVYLYRMTAGDFVATRRLIVLR